MPGLSLQPSVLIRLALIVVVAVEITRARKHGWPPRQLLGLGALIATALALVGGAPDIGSAAVIACVIGTLAFLGGVPLRYLAVPALLAVIALGISVRVSPYAWERVTAFADPSSTSAAAWQSRNSVLAVGSGGLVGRGLGQGLQKLGFLPEPHTDFVFAIAVEEAGLAGATVLLLLITTITWRGLEISRRLRRLDYSLIAAGLTLAFTVQSLLHVAVCLGLAPTKGIPLPLISYGKTDVLISLASMGLLLNLSREAW
jgi:cell division protein FtsW